MFFVSFWGNHYEKNILAMSFQSFRGGNTSDTALQSEVSEFTLEARRDTSAICHPHNPALFLLFSCWLSNHGIKAWPEDCHWGSIWWHLSQRKQRVFYKKLLAHNQRTDDLAPYSPLSITFRASSLCFPVSLTSNKWGLTLTLPFP